MPANRTPFEIRFDTLQLAKDILVEEYHANVAKIKMIYDESRIPTEINKLHFPTFQTISDKAYKIRAFVDDKPKEIVQEPITIQPHDGVWHPVNLVVIVPGQNYLVYGKYKNLQANHPHVLVAKLVNQKWVPTYFDNSFGNDELVVSHYMELPEPPQ